MAKKIERLEDLELKNTLQSHIHNSLGFLGGTLSSEREKSLEYYQFGNERPYIESIVRAFNIPIIMVQGYEADDVIGTVAKQAEKEGFQVYMVTPDKDYAQLVSENVFMYKPSRQGNGVDILGEKEVLEKWQIQRVDQVIDVLGLQGDSVDNIPGIPGIGPKTAVKLLAKYDTVEGLIEHSHELKGKQKEKVEEFKEQAILSKELATINLEVPIQFNADTYIIDPINKEALSKLFKELEFRSLAKQILGEGQESAAPAAAGTQGTLFGDSPTVSEKPKWKPIPEHSVAEKNIENTAHNYHLVDNTEGRAALIEQLAAAKSFAFDTETTGIDATQAEMVGMSFAIKAGEAYYVPVPVDKEGATSIIHEFKAVFENAAI